MFIGHRRCGGSGNHSCPSFNGSNVPSVPIPEDASRAFVARNCTFPLLRYSAVLSSEERMEVLSPMCGILRRHEDLGWSSMACMGIIFFVQCRSDVLQIPEIIKKLSSLSVVMRTQLNLTVDGMKISFEGGEIVETE